MIPSKWKLNFRCFTVTPGLPARLTKKISKQLKTSPPWFAPKWFQRNETQTRKKRMVDSSAAEGRRTSGAGRREGL